MPGRLVDLLEREIEGAGAEQESVFALFETLTAWVATGFDKVGTMGLYAGIVLVLVGILVKVVRSNMSAGE